MLEKIVVPKVSLENSNRVQEISENKEWSMEQCLEVLLAYGIGHIHIKELLAKENERHEEKTDSIIKEHIRNEGRYSSYKFKNFQLSRDNKIMEARKTGFSYENQNLKASLRSVSEGEIHD